MAQRRLDHAANAVSIMPLLILNTFSMGLVTPNAVHGALEPMPRIAGVASSAFGSIRMLGGAISSEFVAIWYHGTPVAMGATMALFAACALVVGLLLIQRPRSQREHRESDASRRDLRTQPGVLTGG